MLLTGLADPSLPLKRFKFVGAAKEPVMTSDPSRPDWVYVSPGSTRSPYTIDLASAVIVSGA